MALQELFKKEYSIGRNQSLADIFINSESASERHAKVSVIDNVTLLLEDLRSSNGTYVNGERIRSKIVSLSDKIKIGDKEFAFKEYFRTENGLIKSFRPTNDFTEEFEQLRQICLEYQHAKDKIKNQQSTNRFLRSTLPIVTPLIGVGFSVFNFKGKDNNPVMTALPTVISVLLGVSIAWLLDSPKIQNQRDRKNNDLDANHRRTFVCPKCQRPFERPLWDQIASQKIHGCGAILVR